MKNNQFLSISLALILCCNLFFACKKSDDTYYNYSNTLQKFDGNALQYLQTKKGLYDSLLIVLNRLPHLKDTLSSRNITLFAVTNKSFQISVQALNDVRKRTNKTPLYLRNMDAAELDTLACRYILNGQYSSADFVDYADGLLIASLNYNYKMHVQYDEVNAAGFIGGGPVVITFTDPKNSIFVRYWLSAPTNAVNIKTSNATINVVSPSHDFGFGEFVTRFNK
jgi:hypothetical protein